MRAQVGQVEAEAAGRQRDKHLAGRQHKALPQVREAGREEWRLQPGHLQVPPSALQAPLQTPVFLAQGPSAKIAVLRTAEQLGKGDRFLRRAPSGGMAGVISWPQFWVGTDLGTGRKAFSR